MLINQIEKPKCYSAFYSSKRPCCHVPHVHEKPPIKVKIGSLIGAATGALGAVFLMSRMQSRALKRPVSMLNVKYNEFGIQGVATASLAGGLTAGLLLDDKKHRNAKVREGIHQAIANILFPLILIGAGNKLYDKLRPSFVSKQIPKAAGVAKLLNDAKQIIPRFAITAAGLVGGVHLGTKVSNKINDSCCSHHCHERKVKPLDFIYHPDDVATALVLSDKGGGAIQKVVGKIIPPIFTLCGYETGIKR